MARLLRVERPLAVRLTVRTILFLVLQSTFWLPISSPTTRTYNARSKYVLSMTSASVVLSDIHRNYCPGHRFKRAYIPYRLDCFVDCLRPCCASCPGGSHAVREELEEASTAHQCLCHLDYSFHMLFSAVSAQQVFLHYWLLFIEAVIAHSYLVPASMSVDTRIQTLSRIATCVSVKHRL